MTRRARITIRQAHPSDARRIHALIAGSLEEGRLLPRTPDDVKAHVQRFIVAVRGRQVVGCAELAPLSSQVAEVRSLVVDERARHLGVGSRLVEEVRAQARRSGFDRLCAFTHAPGLFTRMGFSLVPHRWVPEKIATDCTTCQQFRRCGQSALVLPLDTVDNVPGHDRVWTIRAI